LPDLCTPEEAGAFLRVSRNTTYELLKTGKLPSITFGRLIRIPKAELMKGSK
jgi:excisionase family DNA binding protein